MTSDLPDPQRQAATSSERTSAEAMSTVDSNALHRLRFERDAALEDIAFLREQLRSTEAFCAYRFERLHAEHRSLLNELARLGTGRHRRSRRDAPAREEVRAAPSEPADASLPPRTR